MRVVIAGASGFLGSALTRQLRADGHEVTRLVRRSPTAADEAGWDPSAGTLDPAVVTGADAVVSLAGSPIGTRVGPVQVPFRPWTSSYRRTFRESRVRSTRTLAEAVAAADRRPEVFVAGSAVGYYGDAGDTVLDETAPRGDGFLPETAAAIEDATAPAEVAGVRVVQLRTGLPLDRRGGMLGPQLPLFRLGLGGRIGDGSQWQPVLSLADWVSTVTFLLGRDDLAGPVNAVAPTPVTNAEFTRVLGELLSRPAALRIPPFVLRTALGEFGKETISSKRVVPRMLEDAGFQFAHPDLRTALRAALDTSSASRSA